MDSFMVSLQTADTQQYGQLHGESANSRHNSMDNFMVSLQTADKTVLTASR